MASFVARRASTPNRRRTIAAAIALAIYSVSCSGAVKRLPQADQAGGDKQERIDEARRNADDAAQQLTGELLLQLKNAIDEGGLPHAVGVCGEVAQQVAARLSAEKGLRVRRTALRVRNPSNIADEFERAWLLRADAAVRSGEAVESLYEVVEGENGGAELRHLRPIIFPGAVCSNCHGPVDAIDPQVRALLRERYPSDQATGFQPGDLRGAISVRVPLR